MFITRPVLFRFLLPLALMSVLSYVLTSPTNESTCHLPNAANLQGNIRLQVYCVYLQFL